MTTEVSICNSALIKLGAERITDLADDSKEAQLCNEQYTKIRDELLYSHPWNFATKSVTLTSNGNTHAWNNMNEYDLPTDYLRVWDLSNQFTNWTMEDDGAGVLKLYADDSQVEIRYIFKQTDVTKYSTKFVELLALKLAVELCYSLVQSASLKQTLVAEYQEAIRDSRSFDAQENTPGRIDSGLWQQIRK
jgi:hypothetical protein